MTLRSWAAPILPYVNAGNKELFTFLGFYEDIPVPAKAQTSADVLQYLLENKLAMQEKDKDMIVMQHEIEFDDKLALSTLLVKGTDHLRTAMAKTVGLPLGIAACLILENKIQLRGVQIPTSPEIYTPVLAELEKQGIIFLERITKKEKK
jgi:saccharopine dehydrogenase (NADP+, L-glutamate forming)